MNLKSLETWAIEKNLKSVPGVVDINPFGGPTREYQVRIDPDKLIDYGLSISQVEQQLANNNANAGGSFIEEGEQQVNVREVGLVKDIQDIGNTVLTTKGGTPVRVKDIGVVTQGPEIRLGQFGRATHLSDGRILDNDDVVSGIAALQKGDDAQPTLDGIHQKVKELNDQILPKGVKLVPFIDRSDLLHFTTHTVLHNLTEGMILVVVILFLFLGNVRGALIVALTIPFSLLFAAICLDLKHIPANLLSLGALDFGMVVDGAVVMVENIVRHLARKEENGRSIHRRITEAAHEVQRPVFYAIAIIITAYLPIFTLQAVEGRLFRPMAWTVAFALVRSVAVFHDPRSGSLQPVVPPRREGMEESGDGVSEDALSPRRRPGQFIIMARSSESVLLVLFSVSILLSAGSSAPSFFLIWMRALYGSAVSLTKARDQVTASALPTAQESCSVRFLKQPTAPARPADRMTGLTTRAFSTRNSLSV